MHRTVRAMAAAIVVLWLAGCAQAPASMPLAADANGGEGNGSMVCIRGHVLTEDLWPVADASVQVAGREPNITGPEGSFEVCGVVRGVHQVTVLATGYHASTARIEAPATDVVFVLVAAPAVVPFSEVRPYTLYYEAGWSTLDTTVSRNGVNRTTCGPCAFSLWSMVMPGFIVFEADWTRTTMPPEPWEDQMYHILRAGAPFDAGTDVGTGAMARPLHFEYSTAQYGAAAEAARQQDGLAFSGSVFCSGQPVGFPCLDQRIDVYVSLLFHHASVPPGFTALPVQ